MFVSEDDVLPWPSRKTLRSDYTKNPGLRQPPKLRLGRFWNISGPDAAPEKNMAGHRPHLLKLAAACGSATILAFAGAGQANATPRTESSWTALTDEPSRAQLFQEYVVPAGRAAHVSAMAIHPFAIPRKFTFPDDTRYDSIEKKPRTNSIFGIDVSHYQPLSLHFDHFRAQGISFVFVKATQGTGGADKHFGANWTALGKLPAGEFVARGAYHFLSSRDSGRDQANAFVAYVKLHGGFRVNDLPPVVDLEWDVTKQVKDRWVGHSADAILKTVLDCMARIKELTGRTPILYTAKSWFGPQTIPLSRFVALKAYPVWIADYDPRRKLEEHPALPAGATQALWQFDDAATITLDGTDTDASIFYGSPDQFRKVFGVAPGVAQ